MNMKGKTKAQKGITLIALIITIVVLLILAAVAISSIQGDGILGYASNAASSWNQAAKNEQDILQYYEGYLEHKGTLTKEDLDELEIMKRYVMGKTGAGRDASEIVNLQTYIFQDDKETTDVDESTITTLNLGYNENYTRIIGYCKYNNRAYKITLSGNGVNNVVESTAFRTEGVELIYKPEGREGTPVAYDSNGDGNTEEWVIITDRGGKVEIVSKDVAKDKDGNVLTLTLGGNDSEIKGNLLKYLDLNNDKIPDDLDGDKVIEEGGVDYNKDENITSDPQDIAIASYNNAITTINNYCKSLVKEELRDKVRSVGGTSNTYTAYHSTKYDDWGDDIKIDVASGDMQYELDFVKMSYYGIVYTADEYWLASRVVYEISDYAGFGVRDVREGMLNYYDLWFVRSGGFVYHHDPSRGVRLVITNPGI